MEGARFKDETSFGTFPSMIAFVRFTLWSLMNSLFFLIMGQMFPTEHSEKYPGQFNPFQVSEIVSDVTQKSIQDTQTSENVQTEQCFEQPDQETYSFNIKNDQEIFEEPAEIIDLQVSETASAAAKTQKRRRQRKPRKDRTEGTRVDLGDGEVKQDDLDAPWMKVAKEYPNGQKKERQHKVGNDREKSSKPAKTSKPRDSKCVRKAESWPPVNRTPRNWSSKKADKEEMEVSEMQSANKSERSYSHSMLRKLSPPSTPLAERSEDLVIIKPVRQPIGPVLGHIGFSKEYKNSRRATLC